MEFVGIEEGNYSEVAAIYEEGIRTGMATFETQVPDWQTWNKAHLEIGRTALIEQGHLLAWGALAPVSNRYAYRGVAEISVYVAESARGRGLGTAILQELIRAGEQNNLWTLQAGIMRQNKVSIEMHRNCGFRVIGFREKVAQLHGVWTDSVLMERRSKIVGTLNK
ncbi:MAG: N-acetyltransferase family protein [Flavobacteriaceae bacterium]|nr:N-acetyltransferase family protein [Flavobacteriaceae bacterium]